MEKKQKDDVLETEIEEIFHPDFIEKKTKNKKANNKKTTDNKSR